MIELKEASNEWKCSIFDAAYELIFIYYEAAGFDREVLAYELNTKTAEEILQMYYDM
jgi:hypothetical protein